MRSRMQKDVLVVGAGPVGLASALLLSERKVSVQIIDEEWRTGAHSYALALHPGSIEILQRAGLGDDLQSRGLRIDTIVVHDGGERLAELQLSEAAGNCPYVVVLQQDALEDLIEQRLRQRGIEVGWNQRLAAIHHDGDRVDVTIEELGKESGGYAMARSEWVVERTRGAHASFVIGADGHRSTVRRLLDTSQTSAGLPEVFSVFEFDTDDPVPQQMHLNLDPAAVFWPLGARRCRFSFLLPGASVPADVRHKGRLAVPVGQQLFPHLDESFLQKMLRERAPWFKPSPVGISWSIAVRFERRLVTSFGQGRTWLVGDAAHVASPIGVQSMNLGLHEAEDLATRIDRILREEDGIASLEVFDRNRMSLCRAAFGIEGAPSPSDTTPGWARRYASRLLSSIPASGVELARVLAPLGFVPHA